MFGYGKDQQTVSSDEATFNNYYICIPFEGCGPPPSIPNGSLTSTVPGQTVTYSCNNGYFLFGSATVSCLASGSWSILPICSCKKYHAEPNTVLNYYR